MGDVSIYLVKIDTGKTVRVTLPNIERLSDDERILWDETVWLTWHAVQSRRRDPVNGPETDIELIGARTAASRDAPGRLGPLWTFLFRFGPPRWSRVRAAGTGPASAWSSRCRTCGC